VENIFNCVEDGLVGLQEIENEVAEKYGVRMVLKK